MKSYLKIPKEFFTNPEYQKLSANAKLLYGLLLDRHCLSVSNNLTDDNGETVVFFTREEAGEKLNISRETCYKCFVDLKSAGLLHEKYAGVGKSRILYVKKPTCKVEKSAPVMSEKPYPNKTELNKTELNKTDLNIDSFEKLKYFCEGFPELYSV